MSKLSVIKTNDAALIKVGSVDITVAIYNGKLVAYVVDHDLVAYVVDHDNDTFTEVNGQYPALEDRGDMQSESMMLHGGA